MDEGEVPRVAGLEKRAFEHPEQRVRLEEYTGAGEGNRGRQTENEKRPLKSFVNTPWQMMSRPTSMS